MRIELPSPCLVVLIGASGSGKSTFARKHFAPFEILSSDFCRALASDDENDQAATKDAFEILHFIAERRLGNYKTVVVDATNVQEGARKPLVALARRHDLFAVAVVLDVPPRVALDRNKDRPDRQFGEHVVPNHVRDLKRSLKHLKREGFRFTYVLSGEEIETAEFERTPLHNYRPEWTRPFDIVGDVHGCREEMEELLTKLGYDLADPGVRHPEGRRLVLLGDLVDRGPDSPGALKLAMRAQSGGAIVVPGNHDIRLLRKLSGRDVKLTHGLAETLTQMEGEPGEFLRDVRDFLDRLTSHYVLDGGGLVVAHAGMKEEYQGRGSGRVREFALYGEATGETDEFGLPVRYDWASEYRGKARVVYGHTPVPEAEWLNNTIDIDTGCVFGGSLTALRYPEMELVSVPAARTYYEPAKPLRPEPTDANLQQAHDDVLDLADVTGRRGIETSLRGRITIAEENAIAALEVMSRFAADPRLLPYLPPTMAPTETSAREGILEHPDEAFAYYRTQGAGRVVCEEKHMGSRAVVLVARSAEALRGRFGVSDERSGSVVTRTGRPFFPDPATEAGLVARVRDAAERAGLFDELASDWLLLDAELMPWSAKAQGLLRDQYAAVGASGGASSAAGRLVAERAAERGLEGASDLAARMAHREEDIAGFVAAYRRYCWSVASLDDLRLAPFHLLASEGAVHTDKDHLWHMATLARLAGGDPTLMASRHLTVDLEDEASVAAGVAWWEEMTSAGGEGMVVKPLSFLLRGPKGLAQPAIKCRGAEYLRLIYGPEYLRPENLARLRQRGVNRKRSLALREFALGIEALERFVRREPLRRVHECVFGVLALESEPVDPRL